MKRIFKNIGIAFLIPIGIYLLFISGILNFILRILTIFGGILEQMTW